MHSQITAVGNKTREAEDIIRQVKQGQVKQGQVGVDLVRLLDRVS